MKHFLDSSCWLEFFAGTDHANAYAIHVNAIDTCITSPIVIHEVFRKIWKQYDEQKAETIAAHIMQAHVINLTPDIAMSAVSLRLQHSIAMADSLILATARAYNATLWTHDSDFADIHDVQYIKK